MEFPHHQRDKCFFACEKNVCVSRCQVRVWIIQENHQLLCLVSVFPPGVFSLQIPKYALFKLAKLTVTIKLLINKLNIKGMSPSILDRLSTDVYSQVRTHYCATRELLPAASLPWADSSLLSQPGNIRFLHWHHIDAGLSADTRST